MEKLFVPYELAVKLRNLGFDEHCLAGFLIADEGQFNIFGIDTNHVDELVKNSSEPDSWLTAPLYQQVVDWLREKHNISIEVWHCKADIPNKDWSFSIYTIEPQKLLGENDCSNYYEALTKAIESCLKIIENKPLS